MILGGKYIKRKINNVFVCVPYAVKKCFTKMPWLFNSGR